MKGLTRFKTTAGKAVWIRGDAINAVVDSQTPGEVGIWVEGGPEQGLYVAGNAKDVAAAIAMSTFTMPKPHDDKA